MTGGWESVRVKSHERVLGVVLFEGVIECKEAGKVVCVGNEGCPDYKRSVML